MISLSLLTSVPGSAEVPWR